MVMMREVIRSARAEAWWRRSERKTYLDIENMFTMKKLSCIIIRNVGLMVKKVLMK